jgi:integrase
MRHAGLRISDATALNDQQLVQRASGKGHALKVFQKKPQEWVYVPIPDWVAAELQALPFRASKDGARYWFWTGRGELDTAINNWYRSISDVVKAVQEAHQFWSPVSPHVFRHTFAISHLNAGTNVKFVSRWLGHASTAVTEKHYSHAIKSTMLASEEAYDTSMPQWVDYTGAPLADSK